MKQQNTFIHKFTKYVSLNVLSMLGLSLYILADTFFIANGVGSHGLTALNLVLPIYSVIYGIGLMIGMGGGILYSIYIGRGRKEQADGVYSTAILLALLIGILITFSGTLINSRLVHLLGGRGEVAVLSEIYLKYIFLFAPAFIMNSTLVCFVRNDEGPRHAMAAMMAGSISNIVLDYIFIFPLSGGMLGAVIATCMAPLISMVILSWHWIKKRNRFSFMREGIAAARAIEIIATGVPTFITELSSGLIMLLFNFVIMDLSGDIGVAAYGIIANLALIVVAVYNGISQGIQPILGEAFGQGDNTTVIKSFRWALILSAAAGILCCTLGLFQGEVIASWFNKDNDLVLTEIAARGMRIYFTAFIVMGINMNAIAFLAAVQRVRESFFLSMLKGVVLIIPLVFLLAHSFGLTGVWFTIPLAELVALIFTSLFIARWMRQKRVAFFKVF